MLLSYFLRHTESSPYFPLDDHLVQWPDRVVVQAEERLLEFRATTINVTLRDQDGQFGLSTGDHYLDGQEEISVWIGAPPDGTLVWAGTIDPNSIIRDPLAKTFSCRVLQHGSLLNTINAGLPDWTVDANGNIVFDYSNYTRYKGTADQWKRSAWDHGAAFINEIDQESATVYYTPSAQQLIADAVYKARFSQRVRHFHTANNELGNIEYPFPNVSDDNGNALWTGQFRPHYHPNFDVQPDDWPTTLLVQDKGSYTRTPDPQRPFRRFPIADVILQLVQQFNREVEFPLDFNPETDCVIASPVIEHAVEILARDSNNNRIDILYRDRHPTIPTIPERLFALVRHAQIGQGTSRRYPTTLYVIQNDTEAIPVLENIEGWYMSWPLDAGFRFARVNQTTHFNASLETYIYQVKTEVWDGGSEGPLFYGLVANVQSYKIAHQSLGPQGPFDVEIREENPYPNYPQHLWQLNRSVRFIDGEGNASFRDAAGELYPPELLPQYSALTPAGVHYASHNAHLIAEGLTFDRVAVDAENTKLSSLLSVLAELTHSRWWVTPDRRLKFFARSYAERQITLSPKFLNKPFTTFQRSFEDIDPPTLRDGLVLNDNLRSAHQAWFAGNVKTTKTPGAKLTLRYRDLPDLPAVGDAIFCDDPDWPEIPDQNRAAKYESHLQVESVAYHDADEQIEITAALPAL